MRNDAINMEVNEGLLAFLAEEEGAVGGVVHEEVFSEDGGAGGVEGGGEGIGPDHRHRPKPIPYYPEKSC